MSKLKNLLKRNKNVVPTIPVPRSEDEINKDYTEVCAKAGQVQYNLYLLTKNLEALNGRLREIDLEMRQRQELKKVFEAEKAKENAQVETKAANV